MSGKTIGKYRIIEQISQSAMATVYKALHPQLNRIVAIKVLNRALADSPQMLERFRREARAVAALQHPHIVQLYDFDIVDGTYYMVMEYIEGETLARRLERLSRRGRRMPLLEALRAIAQVGEALAYAHERGMLHRDVKPGNIMFRQDGSAVLADFGIAKILSAPTQLTRAGEVAGTPAYMAPEQWIEEKSDHRSDVYSLGVVLYQTVTGRLPFDEDTPGRLMYKHISESPPPPRTVYPGVPAEVERIILRALAKAPANRYQTARELVDDLETIIYQIESTADTNTLKRPPLRRRPASAGRPNTKRDRLGWALVALAMLLVLGGGLVKLVTSGAPPSRQTTVSPDPTGTALAARLATLEAALTSTPTPSPPTSTLTPLPPTSTPTPPPTSTPTPPRTPSPTSCVPDMRLERDVNYYDAHWWGLVNATLNKTWRLVNDGPCPWPADTVLVHLEGEAFGLTEPFQVGPLEVGAERELSVPLRVPATPGPYKGHFQLQTASGQPIGEPLVVEVIARLEPPATPTLSQPEEPVRIAGFELFEWQADPDNHVWRGKIRLWARGGTGQYVWYRDTLDNPLPGDVLEFEWGICRDFFGSVWVTSGDTVDHESLYIPYPEPCE